LYDGIVDPGTLDKAGNPLPGRRICIRNNKNQSLINLDAGRGFKNASLNAAPFDCQLAPIKTTASK
ncbi:MAG: hypothetical protein EOO39_33175, partial [Cytophagaceae bacterium]